VQRALNQQKWLGFGVASICLLLAIVVVRASFRAPVASLPSQMYFTDDDGKTYFADDSGKVPPFDHDGKTALLAGVFQCSGGQPFVAYVLRYTPDGKQALEAMPESKRNSADIGVNYIKHSQAEVKAPGSGTWLRYGEQFEAMVHPACDGGSSGIAQPIFPGE
jgi:hypothetical protein